jgi:hypothetical protein
LKRITLLIITFAFLVTGLGYVYSQSDKAAARAKPGKVLVKSLPTKVEGAALVGDKIQAKPGYKFVKQANGTVVAARMGGGGGLGAEGSWSCSSCGDCKAVISGGYLSCQGSCTGNASCTLTITVGKLRTAVISY